MVTTTEPEARARRWTRLQLVLAALCVAFWLAILGWTLVAEHGDPPDRLADRRFPEAAEPVCAAAMATVESYGRATAVGSIEARADLVDRQGEVFEAMLEELRRLPVPDGEQGEWVRAWLADWRTHLEDRRRWAAELHAGADPPFVETARGNDQVSEAVDAFAEVNDMPSCSTFNDV